MRFLYLLVILINIHHISCMERNNKTNSELFERLRILEEGSYASNTVESFPVFHRIEKGIFGQEDGTVTIKLDVLKMFQDKAEQQEKRDRRSEWIKKSKDFLGNYGKNYVCRQIVLTSCMLPGLFFEDPTIRYGVVGFSAVSSLINTCIMLRIYYNWKKTKQDIHHIQEI